MKMEKEIEQRFEALEKRLTTVEKELRIKRPEPKLSKGKGPAAAVDQLVSDGVFDKPKSVQEAKEELEARKIFYSVEAVRIAIFRKKSALTRIKQDGVWKYVVRK